MKVRSATPDAISLIFSFIQKKSEFERLGLTVEVDDRLVERVLSSTPLYDWQEKLAETFVNLDLNFAGGESSRAAMSCGVSVVNEIIQQAESSAAIVTHGNLMTLILKFFDERIGYTD